MSYRTGAFRVALAFLTLLRLVVNSAHRFVYPFLPAIGRGLGISLEQAGLLVSARWAAGLGTPAIVAVLGRGERRRRLLAVGLALFAVGAATTAATNVYAGAIVGFVLMGIAKPLYDVAAQSYLADRLPYAVRARYMSVMELTWAGGLLVGAPAAGWLIASAGWRAPFWVVASIAAVAVAVLAVAVEDDGELPAAPTGAPGWDRSALAFLLAVALFAAAAEVMFVVLGAWLEDGFGVSLLALGGLATFVALAELGGEGSVLAFADRLGKRVAVAAGLVVAASGFVGLAIFHRSLGWGIAAAMVAFFGFEVTIVGAIPLATELRPGARARFLSWMVVAMAIGRSVGAATGARLFTAYGLPANALLAAAANLVALWMFLAWVREAPAVVDQPTI
jgi:predicted MFS family arabinose efflux permease